MTTAGGRATAFTPAEPFRMVIEEGKVHEFARATASACAGHLRSVDPVSPVTFLASHRLWTAERHSAWRGIARDFRYLLHGEEEFIFHGPPPVAGTELTGRQVIERQYDKRGRRGGTMVFTDLVTRFWTAGGDEQHPLVEERTVIISTEPPLSGATAPPTPASAVARPPVSPSGPSTDDVVFDQALPALTVTDFVKYQGASGDFNPIHHDTAFAQAAGRPGPFAVGMLSAAVAANLLADVVGVTNVRRYRVRWSDIAWPGDVLRHRGVRTAPGTYRVDVTRPDGRPNVTAWAQTTG